MSRFTLVRDCWYACEFIGDEFEEDRCSYSPIKVLGIRALNDGTRCFRMEFFHANYPAGVQGKIYTLQTIERGAHFLVARSMNHKPTRLLQVYALTKCWMMKHFNLSDMPHDGVSVERWLEKVTCQDNYSSREY